MESYIQEKGTATIPVMEGDHHFRNKRSSEEIN